MESSGELEATANAAIASCATIASTNLLNASAMFDGDGDHGVGLAVLGTLLGTLQWIPGILYWLITFTTITVPSWLFTLFSMSLTFTLNFTTLLVIIVGLVSFVSWVVRYRFLNMYARLPPEPQRKEPQIDLYPDVPEGDSKGGFSNYLDEFLSAIKVFGYLERPVFHELTRTMQTRKLIAGETLLLEEEKGFCLVVDGLVQIFVKSSQNERLNDSTHWLNGSDYATDEDDGKAQRQGYQLLTEVKNGAPMSSLFSVLSLFTEDLKLRHAGDDDGSLISPPPESTPASALGHPSRSNPNSPGRLLDDALSSSGHDGLRPLSTVPPLSLDSNLTPDEPTPGMSRTNPRRHRMRRRKSAHPDIVARATVDTTIAIIPATAFRRLTRVYPRASAHIVQVILSRLQRVTLATAHSYLGLTDEVLRTEKLMSRYTSFELPNRLRGSILDELKAKFVEETRPTSPTDDGSGGIALHNPRAGHRRRSSSSLRKDLLAQMKLTAVKRNAVSPPAAARSVSGDPRSSTNAGDLIANVQAPFGNPPDISQLPAETPLHSPDSLPSKKPLLAPGRGDNPTFVDSNRMSNFPPAFMDTADTFREAILACVVKAIGLTNPRDPFLTKPAESVEQSPRLVSYDSRRQMATFANAFGQIDPYDGSADGDSDSVASTSLHSATGSVLTQTTFYQDMQDEIEIVFFPQDTVLVEEGERAPGLYYVIDGFLDVGMFVEGNADAIHESSRANINGLAPHDSAKTGIHKISPRLRSEDHVRKKAKNLPTSRQSLFTIKPGGLAGYISAVSGYRSFVDVRAKTDVYVGFLPRAAIERVVEKFPVILLTMAKRITSLLPRLILHIDFALEWVQIDAGEVIHHQGDDSDAIYIVLNGRLRAVLERDEGEMRVVGEFGQGESIGELEVMTETPRTATLHAIRDTELARFPRSLFNSLAREHSNITIKISRIIAQRMRKMVEDPIFDAGKDRQAAMIGSSANSSLNLRTVTILPVAAGVPAIEFGTRLLSALSQVGVANGATSLNQAAILNHLGRHAFSRMGKLKLSQYLADLEERYGMVLYIADTNVNSPWTQTCIRQADCILLVGLAEGSPAVGEYERFLLGMKTTARKDLVLLHVDRYCPPGLTRRWLRNRLWINGGHHHVQMAFRTQSEPVHPQIRRFGTALKQRVQVLQAEIQKYTSRRIRQTPLYSAATPFKSDFHRLARKLCGKSVGLVLGGGGARGISQIGVIRALEEDGVPVDMVGGTSIGAFVGALYAQDADLVPMYGRAKKFAGRMASMWRFALDLTYPTSSYTTGHEFNRGIFKAFGDAQIEDFWLDYYCNTTNISKSRSDIHTSGYAWRYVRASMSLAGLIPPLCDEGSLLLDGGYIDNLTVAHMKSLGADIVFAIDVGALDDQVPQNFGDSLSGTWALFNRWNPFSSYNNPPTLSDIQARLAYVSSVDALERAKNMPGCLYLRPAIDAYGTLDFAKFDEIYEVGYASGKAFLEKLRDQGVLPAKEGVDDEKKRLRRTTAPRRASI